MLLAATLFFVAMAVTTGSLDIVVGLAPVRCLAGFLLGMLVYFRRDAVARLPHAILSAIQIAAVIAIVAIMAIPSRDPLVVPAFVLLVATMWTDRGLLPRLLACRPLLWLGDISYSIYLNHVPLMTILAFVWAPAEARLGLSPELARIIWIVLVYAIVLAVSHLTFNHVERPARQWLARRWSGHAAPPIATSPPGP